MFKNIWEKLFGKSEIQKILESIAEKRYQRGEQRKALMRLSNYELAAMDNETMFKTLASCCDINSSAFAEKINQIMQVKSDNLYNQYISSIK